MHIICVRGDMMMKNKNLLYFVLTLIVLIGGCAFYFLLCKGSVQGTVSWKYNDFVGSRPDVGAKVYLFSENYKEKKGKLYEYNSSRPDDGLYFQTVDKDGKFILNDIPSGSYYLLIVSENTNRDILNDSRKEYATSAFKGKIDDMKYFTSTVLYINKFELKSIDIGVKDSIVKNIDFGITHFK